LKSKADLFEYLSLELIVPAELYPGKAAFLFGRKLHTLQGVPALGEHCVGLSRGDISFGQGKPLDTGRALEAELIVAAACGNLDAPSDCMKVGFGGVERPDVVGAPEFEGLSGRKRPSSYVAGIGVEFFDGKMHTGKDIFSSTERLLSVWLDDTEPVDGLNVFRPGTTGQKKQGTKYRYQSGFRLIHYIRPFGLQKQSRL